MLATVYATDENIAVRVAGDYRNLAPESQKLAAGTDGVILSGDPWRLRSATTDWVAAGVESGHVVRLNKPLANYGQSGELFAVESVNSDGALLRRIGKVAGEGLRPSPAAGLASIDFVLATFDPQIEECSFWLNRTLGIDPSSDARRPTDLTDLRDLRDACCYRVIWLAYAAMSRQQNDDFDWKARRFKAEFDEILARLAVRWGTDGDGEMPTRPYFARLTR